MAKKKIFMSFRYKDGHQLKETIVDKLVEMNFAIDKSEDKDRKEMTDETIKKYIYQKLSDTSITLVLLTPMAVNYRKDNSGDYDDWLYDELRYSLEDRTSNKTNGVIAIYTPEAEPMLIVRNTHTCSKCNTQKKVNTIKHFDNLVRNNMMNVKKDYKKNKCDDLFDSDYDSYISLVAVDTFLSNPQKYLDIAEEKRQNTYKYDLNKIL